MPLSSGLLQTGTTSSTTSANEVCIGVIAVDQTATYASPTNSFSIVHESTGTADLVVLEKIVSSSGTQSTGCSFSGSTPVSWNSAGVIITLKAVATTNTQGLLMFC